MERKNYAPPVAETILFAPEERIASANSTWVWKWGDWKTLGQPNPSVEGYGELWPTPWDYESSDNRYKLP